MFRTPSAQNRLTLDQKLEIANEIHNGVDYACLERKYGAKTRTLTQIMKEILKIRKEVECLSFAGQGEFTRS